MWVSADREHTQGWGRVERGGEPLVARRHIGVETLKHKNQAVFCVQLALHLHHGNKHRRAVYHPENHQKKPRTQQEGAEGPNAGTLIRERFIIRLKNGVLG